MHILRPRSPLTELLSIRPDPLKAYCSLSLLISGTLLTAGILKKRGWHPPQITSAIYLQSLLTSYIMGARWTPDWMVKYCLLPCAAASNVLIMGQTSDHVAIVISATMTTWAMTESFGNFFDLFFTHH